jgi:CPSF A subunit region
MKNFIVIADVCNSVQFLVWREDDLTLTLVSKDMDSQTVLSTAFLSDGGSLGIVVGDDEANIQLMKFDPRLVFFLSYLIVFVRFFYHNYQSYFIITFSMTIIP